MTNRLHNGRHDPSSGRIERRPKAWSPERRVRQASLIRGWQPWRRSTGPRTEAGKARCAKNALRHGYRSRAYLHKLQRIRNALRLAARNNEWLRALIRLREISARLPRRLVRRSLGEGGSCHAAKAGPRIKFKVPPPSRSCLRDGRFRAVRQGASMSATHLAHALGEDHRWP